MGNSFCSNATLATNDSYHKVCLIDLQAKFASSNISHHNYSTYPETYNFSIVQWNGDWEIELYDKYYIGQTSMTCSDAPLTFGEYLSAVVKNREKMGIAFL